MNELMLKITSGCVGALLTMLAGGFFAIIWAKTERVARIEKSMETLRTVDIELGNKIGTLEARIDKFSNYMPYIEDLQASDVMQAQEAVQQTLDKAVYRQKELRD